MERHSHHGLYFIIGALIGGLAALLYAPKTGEQMREFLKKKAHESEEVIDHTKHDAEKLYHDTKEQIDHLINNVSHTIDEKVKKIQAKTAPKKGQ